MKIKKYEFTENEILIIRDALIEHFQNSYKNAGNNNPIKQVLIDLKDRFKNDARII